jgi:hypothetical protein
MMTGRMQILKLRGLELVSRRMSNANHENMFVGVRERAEQLIPLWVPRYMKVEVTRM